MKVIRNRDRTKDFSSSSSEQTPCFHDFKRLEDKFQYDLYFDKKSDVPSVCKCISIDINLLVCLSYNGHFIPACAVPTWT